MSKAENPNQGKEIEIISIDQREIELLEKNRKINLQKLFTPQGMDLMIAEIQKEVADFSADISTKEGRAKIISMAAKVAKCKSPIKNLASELKEESRKLIDGVNAQWNRYESAMDELRDEIRKPVDEIEEREAAILKSRQDQLRKIEDFKNAIYTSGEASKLYVASIEEVKKLLQFDWGSDWAFRAETVANEALYILGERLVAAVKYEEDQAELAKLKKEAAERAQKDHEEKIAREAAERERKAAIEREAKIEADKKAAEQAKINAEIRAKEAERLAAEQAAQAELARIAAEKKAKEDVEKERLRVDAKFKKALEVEAQKKAAEEKLAANKRHRAKINREAAKAIEEILNACEEEGVEFETIDKKIISAIENGLVPHVQINY